MLLLLFAYGYGHQTVTEHNHVSRLDFLYGLFIQKSFSIDAYHANTPCKSLHDGHYYSDKAPGTAVLAIPAFAMAMESASLANVSPTSKRGVLICSWIATFGSVGIISALGGVALFIWLSRYVCARHALLATLGLSLGAAPFPYSTMLFPHAAVVALFIICLQVCETRRFGWSKYELSLSGVAATSGLCCGLAIACEYSAAMAVIGIFLFLITGENVKIFGAAAMFTLGALPSLLLIASYHWICFGFPFTLAYSHDVGFPEMQNGLFGIGKPSLETALKLLFGPTRGLFFWSPFLLMSFFGYPRLYEHSKRLFFLCYIVPLAQLIVLSGHFDWRGGTTLGPRFLAPALPFLVLPAALGIQAHRRLGILLVTCSVLLTGLGTIICATPSYDVTNPLLEIHLPALINGKVTTNLGTVALGLSGQASIFLFIVVISLSCGLFYKLLSRKPP